MKLVEGEETSHRRNLTTTIGMGPMVIDKAVTITMQAVATRVDTPTVNITVVDPVVRMPLDAGSEIDTIGTSEILLQGIGAVHYLAIVMMGMTGEDREPVAP